MGRFRTSLKKGPFLGQYETLTQFCCVFAGKLEVILQLWIMAPLLQHKLSSSWRCSFHLATKIMQLRAKQKDVTEEEAFNESPHQRVVTLQAHRCSLVQSPTAARAVRNTCLYVSLIHERGQLRECPPYQRRATIAGTLCIRLSHSTPAGALLLYFLLYLCDPLKPYL